MLWLVLLELLQPLAASGAARKAAVLKRMERPGVSLEQALGGKSKIAVQTPVSSTARQPARSQFLVMLLGTENPLYLHCCACLRWPGVSNNLLTKSSPIEKGYQVMHLWIHVTLSILICEQD